MKNADKTGDAVNPERLDPERLDPELSEALLVGIDPISPTPTQSAALKRRIMERIADENHPDLVTVHASGGKWIEIAPNVHIKKLMEDDNFVAHLVRMSPGSSLPAHEHHGNEECVCLEGEVWLGDTVFHPGDFHFAPKGIPHNSFHSRTGCLLYIRSGRMG